MLWQRLSLFLTDFFLNLLGWHDSEYIVYNSLRNCKGSRVMGIDNDGEKGIEDDVNIHELLWDFGTRLYANHDHWEQVKAMKRSGNTASNEIERWSKRSDSDSERR
ncbi:hypothetical protein Tco_0551466 [Tanacetum coccineum]